MRKRTHAREIALQALYQEDVLGRDEEGSASLLDTFVDEATDDPEVRRFARELITGTRAAKDELDARIESVVTNWKLSRVAPVDRSILRMALFEILQGGDTPPKVAINEAIDLAKKFSTEQSGAFVNGILDRVYREGPEQVEGEEDR